VSKSSHFMTTDIRLYFDCNSKKTYIKDFTDYDTSEFPYNVLIEGNGTLYDPTNNLIFGIVDLPIDRNTNPNVSQEYNLNVTTSNTIIPGNYNLNYENGYSFNQTGEDLNMSFISPSIISIPFTNFGLVWAAGDTFNISAATDEANDGTYTISEIVYNSNFNICFITVTTDTFVVPEGGGSDATASLFFSNKYIPVYTDRTYTYTSCSSVTPCITANYDCTSTPFGNITFEDSSTYPTGFVADDKEFTIYYPNGLDFTQSPNPDNYPIENPLIVENGSFVTINTLATGTWSAKLALTTSKTQVDGLVIINVASVVKEFNVSCTSNMCGLSSCLTKLKDRHISYLRSSTVSPLQQYVDNVQLLYTMAREAQACGDKNAYERYIAEIFEVVRQTDTSCGCGCSGSCSGSCDCGCDDGCGCGETGPTWVNNTGININSLLEELAGIPDQVDALQTNVDGLTDDVSALNDWTGIGETLPGGQNLFNAVDGLITTTTNLGGQVNNNTGDITGLQIQVDTLDAEVAALQEQIGDFSPSDSEISTYELMTNDGSKQSVWDAASGTAISSLIYEILVSGDLGEYIFENDYISFFNPTTQTWFYGQVSDFSYSSGSSTITLSFNNTSTYSDGASWQDAEVSFPVYKGDLATGEYNFSSALSLDNDNYWKFADDTHKYWSKIKASFIVNEPYYEGTVQPILIKNSTANKTITLRDLPCGSFVDLELSFEKQYIGSSYDTAILIDVKYNTSNNVALSQSSGLLFGGYSGFNPSFSYGLDLSNGSNEFNISIGENNLSALSVQDITDSSGVQNTNRKVSRYTKGPSYVNNTADNFFTGSQIENIVVNFSNINITLLNIEQSYGKMPVSLA